MPHATQRWLPAVLVSLCLLAGLAAPVVHAEGFDVAAENAQPGTLHWQLPAKAFTQRTLAFADRVSVTAGEVVGLYVSCQGRNFRARALRIGYYDGVGARQVWRSDEQPCVRQSAADVTRSTHMAHAPWKRSLDVDTSGWPEGAYVFTVRSDDGSATYVDLVVRSSGTAGRVVFVSSTQTFEAYNEWGGANLYRGKGGFSTRARAASYDRPNTWGQGSGKFLGYEAPLLRRAEALGLPLAYLTDVDLTEDPAILKGAASIVFGGHAEYWTQAQRDAVLRARAQGSNLLFFGANTSYWRVRLEDSALGARRIMVVYKSRKEDPDTTAPTIRFRDLGQADATLTGLTYSCFPVHAPFVVADASSWVFAGTGARNGDAFPGIVGPEVDKLTVHAPNTTLLGSSRARCGKRTTHSSMVLVRAPSGAVTFAVGTMGWVTKGLGGEVPERSAALVRTVTDNVLRAAVRRGLG